MCVCHHILSYLHIFTLLPRDCCCVHPIVLCTPAMPLLPCWHEPCATCAVVVHDCRVWDTSNGEGSSSLQGHMDVVSSIAVSPDGGTIISGSSDNTVRWVHSM